MSDRTQIPITPEEERMLARAVTLFFVRPRQDQIRVISLLMVENAALAKEVNDRRKAMGDEPLPVYQPNL